MESILSWIHPFWAFGLPIAASVPIGLWMARALDPPADRAGRGLDALPMALCRLLGRREPATMDWKRYAIALLAFNAALFVLTFGLLYAQQLPALEPRRQGPRSAPSATRTPLESTTPAPIPAWSSTPSARS